MLISKNACEKLKKEISETGEVFCSGLFLSARWAVVSQIATQGVHFIVLPTREAAEYCSADLYNLTEKEIMGIDKSLMGGMKYRNGFEYNIHSQTLRDSLERIKDIDLERAGDVFSFYSDLRDSIMSISLMEKKENRFTDSEKTKVKSAAHT